jgi:hypothetical protein
MIQPGIQMTRANLFDNPVLSFGLFEFVLQIWGYVRVSDFNVNLCDIKIRMMSTIQQMLKEWKNVPRAV